MTSIGTLANRMNTRLNERVFDALYSRSLIYNTCWEDPAVDRRALDITAEDTMLVITSAGCNVLDYALAGPRQIHAVDANPRQTALLELKLAGIRRLSHTDFFMLFGEGRHPHFRELYRDVLRRDLSPFAQQFWDGAGDWFSRRNPRNTFYFHSLSGRVALLFRHYLDLQPKLRDAVDELVEARSLDEQCSIYDARVAPRMWNRGVNWALSRQITMSMLGVPAPQHEEVRRQHAGGVPGFVREAVEYVFRRLPLWTNYFWRVYVRGSYNRDCCPEYLKRGNFLALKNGLADRITHHTCTATELLRGKRPPASKFVLLDHMDWLGSFKPEALREEWSALLDCAAPGARVIFRSAHAQPAYLDSLTVPGAGRGRRLRELLDFHPELAARLSRDDRVHTYAGFHIADVRA
ncbi:MAG: BtaA family protein [Burkholderiales bacterium]|nr:BtaA family protein [Burkholderiales bacterium]